MPKPASFTLLTLVFILAFIPAVSLADRQIKTTQQLIVIDPGHGGSQPGIISSFALMEKNIVLALAKKTAALLDDQYNVILTRKKDTTISVDQRISTANFRRADLYISLHLGHSGSRSGFFHYYTQPGIRAKKDTSSPEWKTISLEHTESSKKLAQAFFDIFSVKINSTRFFIKASPVVLLEGSNMPSLLIEPFPISNLPQNKIEQDLFLNNYAKLIAQSIDLYLQKK